LESLAEIVLILVETYVIAVIAIGGILIAITILVIVVPFVITVRLSGVVALSISVIQSPP